MFKDLLVVGHIHLTFLRKIKKEIKIPYSTLLFLFHDASLPSLGMYVRLFHS